MRKFDIHLVLIFATILLFLLYCFLSLRYSWEFAQTHFTDLSYAFLHGQPNLMIPLRLSDDVALFQGKYFICWGPMPAILLLPLVSLFGLSVNQNILVIMGSIISFMLLYKLCLLLRMKYSQDALWLTIFFIFGTVYALLCSTNISAFTVQIVGTTFLIAALYAFFRKSNIWLIGLLVACAGMTRYTLYVASIFFLIELFHRNKRWTHIISFLTPVGVSILLLFLYNYIRFHTPFETGYGDLITNSLIFKEQWKYGTFNLINIPGNLFIMLLKPPDPIHADSLTYILKFPYLRMNEWGAGIFFTSPLFLYTFLVNIKEKYIKSCIITIFFMLIPLLLYGNSGLWQYGYRYALDFFPFLFIMLISVFRNYLPVRAKMVIVYSVLFGLLYGYSIWNIYPFFGIHP